MEGEEDCRLDDTPWYGDRPTVSCCACGLWLTGRDAMSPSRYWRARLLALPDVVLCPLEPGRHRRNADARSNGMRSPLF